MTDNEKKASGVGPWLTNDEMDLLATQEPDPVLAETARPTTNGEGVANASRSTSRDRTPRPRTDPPPPPPPPPQSGSQWAVVYLPWQSESPVEQDRVENTLHALDSEARELESLATQAVGTFRESPSETGSEAPPEQGFATPYESAPELEQHPEDGRAEPPSDPNGSTQEPKTDAAHTDSGLGLWGAPTPDESPILSSTDLNSSTEADSSGPAPTRGRRNDESHLLIARQMTLPVGLSEVARLRIEIWSNPGQRAPRFLATIAVEDLPVRGAETEHEALDSVREWLMDRLSGQQPVRHPRAD